MLLVVLAVYVGVALLIGSGRDYLGYGVETDYVGGFVPEAKRLLAGEPLLSRFHPPLYPMMIAFTYALVGDWLWAGLLVSLISGVVVLTVAYFLCRMLAGQLAAWGALAALFGSAVFMTKSLEATSDLFFLAGFLLAIALAVAALRRRAPILWTACGAVIVLALMTRTNALSLVLLGLAPLLVREGWRVRAVGTVALCGGVAVTLGAFISFALVTSSNLVPAESYKLLAAAYFVDTPYPLSRDALEAGGHQFQSLGDVLTHDPRGLAVMYVRSLYDLAARGFSLLLEPPLGLLFLPGLVLLIGRQLCVELGLVVLIVAGQTLLVSLAPFSARYFLFLVPIAGAGLGETARWLLIQPWCPRRAGTAAVLATAVVAAGLALMSAYVHVSAGAREIAQVVPVVRDLIPRSALMVAYKPHLAFMLDVDNLEMPHLGDLATLHSFVEDHTERDSMYLLYGSAEKSMRPQYAALVDPEQAPPWLQVVARSQSPGAWTLYLYRDE